MIIEQLDKPLPGSLLPTLSGGYYTDPGVFAAEQELIFERSWFCVLHGSDIPNPGDYKLVQVGREQLIVSRNRKREIRAFFNVCRHRGMRVCTEDSGNRRSFQCGYHAWTYDLDGTLIAAPNLTKMPDIDRDDYGLQRIHVREWLGYVWVCTAEDPPSFEERVLGEVVGRLGQVESLDHYQVENLRIGRRIGYEVKANWKLIIENFMECYHCATIHPELTEVIPEFAEGWAAQTNVGRGAEFGDDIEGFTVDGSAGVIELPLIAPDQERRYFAITIRPNVFINMVPDHVIIHRMFPTSESSTYVECDWLFLPEVVDAGLDVSKSVQLFDRVNLQDFDACEKTQPAMASRLYRAGGALVPAEHHIAFFHEWLREALEA
ncbi:aromatic ring-hydroxylating dioxygenase subunit alpha [Microbacterium sp. 18062]|uniref:aromatic ring-hydroxylating oxygenase subunit alpha n=1 Tax=Microbacterium sp. 18062 TaxID=2681410 RepID=UPI00135B8FBF|nr:aromatic ring-hydroxylating dioxygenase subunit alpha [Microbacterium sp. 18062]